MMKKLSSFLFLLVLITCFSISTVQALPVVSLNLTDGSIGVGDSFDVEVWAHDDTDDELLAFGFYVDPLSTLSLITYDGYTIGTGFDDDSLGDVAGSTFAGITDDDVLLATLSFTAGLVEGFDTLSIEGLLSDMSGFEGLYYWGDVYDINASLGITIGATPVPEPATMLLLVPGLFGLVGLKKRKSFKS